MSDRRTIEPVWGSLSDASVMIHASRRQLYRMIQRGELEAVKDGRSTRVNLKKLLERMDKLPRVK